MFTVNDLMERYAIKNSVSIRKFVVRHIDKINEDGEHAVQKPTGWQFDEEAVKRIDDLRGRNKILVIEASENETVQELKGEIETLKSLLIATQTDLIQTQKVLQAQQTKLLADVDSTKNYQADLKLEQELHKVTKKQLEESNRQRDRLTQQLKDLQSEFEQIKKRSLIDRIFNKF